MNQIKLTSTHYKEKIQMSIRIGIETTRKLYAEKIYKLIKDRQNKRLESKVQNLESKVWSMLEVAHYRGFYFGEALLSTVDNSERFIDSRDLINVLFDYVSPIEVYILLVGKNRLNKNDDIKIVKSESTYSGNDTNYLLNVEVPLGKAYSCPSETHFFVGNMVDIVDPQHIKEGEQRESKRDYERVLNRGQQWRNDCRIIFSAVWSNSKRWGYLLTTGFKDISDMGFTDHGVDFISSVLIHAESRGFVYKNFFVNEIPLSDSKSELSDCFALAILLFISPAELYQMLDLTLHFALSKSSKPFEPRLIRMQG